MTIEDINKTLTAAVTNKKDQLDFMVGNYHAIENAHPGEINLSAYDIQILTRATQDSQTFQQIAANLIPLLAQYYKEK